MEMSSLDIKSAQNIHELIRIRSQTIRILARITHSI